MKVFAAMHSSCIYESDYGIISLHFTEKAADNAIKKHRDANVKQHGQPEDWEQWKVECMEVKK